MEDFYFEESNTKHIFIKCLIFIFLIGIAIGAFLYYKKINTINLKTITLEVGSNLSTNVRDYLKSGNNYDKYQLILDGVNTNIVGNYNYKIKYNKHTKNGTIKIVDTTKPIVELDDITIGIDENLDPNFLLLSCEDKSLPCTVAYKNNSDSNKLKNIGTYYIEFIVSDAVGNKVESSAKITVSDTETMSSKMTNDLEYASNSENDDTIKHVFFKKLDKAIYEDTSDYEGMIHEISATDFSEYTEGDIYSTKLITAYNKYGYVIGIQVEITFEDGTKKLLENKKVINNEEE